MARLILLHLTLLTLTPVMHAQSDWWFDSEERERDITGVDNRTMSERSFKERLTLGGTAAFQLGTNTLIGGAPQLGYRVNENLLAGAGITLGTHYPRPVVDHKEARRRALAALDRTRG